MAEKEQAARISAIQRHQVDEAADRARGMRLGFTAFSMLFAAAGVSAYFDRPVLAAIFLGTVAFSAIAVFVNGRKKGAPTEGA